MSDYPWMTRAEKYLGTAEIPGAKHNPTIIGFWHSANLPFKDDETPWCAGFANAMLEDSGVPGTNSGMARSFLTWGVKLSEPVRGCIVVLKRPPNPASGHVAFFDKFVVQNGVRYVRVLGGNQSNKVSYALFKVLDVLGYRMPATSAVPAQKPAAPKPAPTPTPTPLAPVPAPPREKTSLLKLLLKSIFKWGS
jgi:uncharacterized protein (TIGR02594 family)